MNATSANLPSSPKPAFHIAVALVQRAGQWLIAKRESSTHLGGMWEFPGGKRHADETPEQTALRELREECDVDATAVRATDTVTWEYDERVVHITPVICHWVRGEPKPLRSAACRWASAEELRRLAMPPANARFLHVITDLA